MDFAIITIDGENGGEYYVPLDQCQYIKINQLVNVGSNDIYLYKSLNGSDGSYILLKPYTLPEYYESAESEPVIIADITESSFNWIGNIYHEKIIITTGLTILIPIYILITLLIKK